MVAIIYVGDIRRQYTEVPEVVAIIYRNGGGDNIRRRLKWGQSYTEASTVGAGRSYTEVVVEIIYGGISNGGNCIRWRWWQRQSYLEASVLVAIIYGGGGGDHIGGADIMRDLVGELVHSQ